MSWIDEWDTANAEFERLITEAGASVDSTQAVFLRPVLSTSDQSSLAQTAGALASEGYDVAVRGGTLGPRVFAYEKRKRDTEGSFGGFLWLTVHTGLTAWWLTSGWRARQLADAAFTLYTGGQLVAAAACARSLVETAAVVHLDATEARKRWEACKEYAPSITYPLPDPAYKALHDYMGEMLFGGKFKGDVPVDISVLMATPPPRKSVQTPIDRLSKADPSVATTYDLLCNTVHPSVGGTYSYISGIAVAGPGERQVGFRSRRDQGQAGEPEDSLTAAIKSGILRGLHWTTVALDDALRLCDDIALTTRVPHIARTPYWRAVVAADRNSPCVCRSRKKTKACRHEWGTKQYEPSTIDDEDSKPSQ